jgi:peptidoglycan DL-endopeptidase CwlO
VQLSAVLALLLLSATVLARAQAAPSAGGLQAQLDRLNQQSDQLVEQFLAGQLQLRNINAALADLQKQAGGAEQQLARLRRAVGERAVGLYMHGAGTDLMSLLQTSDPNQVLERAQALDFLAQQDGDLLANIKAAASAYAQRRTALQAARAQASALVDQLAGKRREINQKVAETERLLNRLTSRQRAALTGGSSGSTHAPPLSPAAKGAARIAVAFALAQVGDPYQFGAAGPDRWDCSGLTMVAWGRAGVSLPHSSAAQYGIGRHVTRAELQPGDLAFFYSPISHVAMYIGNGQMVDATHTGSDVLVQSLRPAVGFTRPTG